MTIHVKTETTYSLSQKDVTEIVAEWLDIKYGLDGIKGSDIQVEVIDSKSPDPFDYNAGYVPGKFSMSYKR